MGDRPPSTSSRAAPWIQALCIAAIVGVVWIDASTPDFEASTLIYGCLTGIALGLSAEFFKSLPGGKT